MKRSDFPNEAFEGRTPLRQNRFQRKVFLPWKPRLAILACICMPSLLEKAQAGAKKLLRLKSKPNSVELTKYRNFLKVESHRLKIAHRGGGGGRAIAKARAEILDLTVQYLFDEILQVRPKPDGDKSLLSIVAYGGYGRGELSPCSDLDVMVLHNRPGLSPGQKHKWLIDFCQTFFRSLTDVRLKILPVTRSIPDCVHVANEDMQSKTALVETRLVAGDKALFDKMTQTLLAKCIHRREKTYIAARLRDQKLRREKFGNSPYMQEPNIKNGCGGLRDYQNLLWMAFFKKRCRTMEDLLQHEMIDRTEYRQLTAAYDYLLRVRNEMHYLANRPKEVLQRVLQPRVAYSFGFTDRSPTRRLEAFMHEVYTHLRNIHLLSRALEQRMALSQENRGLETISNFLKRRKPILMDGFEFKNGQILLANSRAFKEQPRRLMRVFRHAQQRGLRLCPDLAYALRSQLALADHDFLRDANVRETFIEILNQKGNVARTLRTMHEVGLLGKYLPEFGKLTGKVQHEFYHVYTADEHTIVCLEHLDRIIEAAKPPHSNYKKLLERLNRPYLLYLALILHDAGKAAGRRSSNHSCAGAAIAKRAAQRLGLAAEDTQTLRFLIEQHLTMALISQRRDIEDPKVIQSFAELAQESEHVDLLALLTFSDSMATSQEMWNGFKDTLLRSLHHQAYKILSGDTTQRIAEHKLRLHLRRKIETKLSTNIRADEIDAHFNTLPDRYFHTNRPGEILADIDRVHRFMSRQTRLGEHPLDPVVSWRQARNRGYSILHVATWDYPRVFAKLAGALASTGINILSAKIFSRTDGIILDSFAVVDAVSGSLVGPERRDSFHANTAKILMNQVHLDRLVAQAPKGPPLYQSLEDETIPTRIQFDNHTSERRTIIDIDTEDRVGLLYFIATALAEFELDLSLAKISTERGAAIDSFYVKDAKGEKIRDAETQRQITRQLLNAIAKAGGPDDTSLLKHTARSGI